MLVRFSFTLLILSILLVCIWFSYASVRDKAYYRRVFQWILWICFAMYLNRLFGIAMEENYIPYLDWMVYAERILHNGLTVAIYSLYAFFIYCLIDQFHYYPMWKKVMLFVPGIIADLLLITSPFTHFVFYVEDGVSVSAAGIWIIILIRSVYAIVATARALLKRQLLPPIFGQSLILVTIFSAFQLKELLFFHYESLVYSALIVNIIILLLAITVVEFYKDSQTGLLNRKAFEQYVEREIGKRSNKTVYLVKLKNYAYLKENCHDTPVTEIVKEIAEALKEYIMLSAIYYLGSGRYAVIVRRRDKFDEKDFLEKLNYRFGVPFDMNGVSIHLNLFVAIMNLESGKINKSNFKKYFAACDDMKYRSNDVLEIVQGDSFGIDQLQRYHNVEEAIERALVEKEFKMFYQPIVSSETKKVVSAEALIRLNDRTMGFISPEEFIPISESNGKILEISEFVIDTVFRFVKEHDIQKMGMEFIELNLSVMQCMDKKLTEKLEYFIHKYDIDPAQINLEITETATNFDEKRLKEQLHKIKKLGFSFSLDDYGTGYSNLVRVLEYPVDIIKLDKSIVWSAFHDNDNFVTIKNLISMFHDVRRKIVAEGVESEEQMEALSELGCDYLQGYFYSKPVAEADFLVVVQKLNGPF